MKKEKRTAVCSRKNPGLLVFVLDGSNSMLQGEDEEKKNSSKIKKLNDILNDVIHRIGSEIFDGKKPADKLYISVISYGSNGGDAATICKQGWISELWNQKLELRAKGASAMSNGLTLAMDVVKNFVEKYPNSPAPIVINIADGHPWSNVYGSFEKQQALKKAVLLKNFETTDGNTILLNIHIVDTNEGKKKEPDYWFPSSDEIIYGKANEFMASISSSVTPRIKEIALRKNIQIFDDSIAFVTDSNDMKSLSDILWAFGSSSMIDIM